MSDTPEQNPTTLKEEDNKAVVEAPAPAKPTDKRKIAIKFIQNKTKRHVTFSKRKHGIMKKAYELSVLTGTQVLLLVVSETGLVYTFTTPKFQPIVTEPEGKNLIQTCLNTPDGEEDEEEEEEEDDDDEEDGDHEEDNDEGNNQTENSHEGADENIGDNNGNHDHNNQNIDDVLDDPNIDKNISNHANNNEEHVDNIFEHDEYEQASKRLKTDNDSYQTSNHKSSEALLA
ncbi:hypothetical protein FOG50_00447 [Hanseniaspora uvarum]|nr:hypothetical protein FOG50_00447 [Hanseniaspora uvarum]